MPLSLSLVYTMSQKTWWEKLSRELKIGLWTILYFVILPTALILSIPVYTLRFIASQSRKVFRKDLHKFIHTRSSVLARDDWTGKPSWNLVVWLTMEGVLDLDKFRSDFYKEYVLHKDPNSRSGELSFPEYQQHYATWWGFLFWKWDTEFNIKNHIRDYDGIYKTRDIVDDECLVQIVKELTWKPWHPKRSPWEFLQIRNYRQNEKDSAALNNYSKKSILIFRIHHGLGDGYYILKLLMQDISGINLERALGRPKYARRNIFQRLVFGFLFWIRAPYQFMEMIVSANDVNEWHLAREEMVRPMNAALTECIPLEHIKSIKNAHNVSFTAVITAAITGGLRSMMLERGVPVPKEMHSAVAVPMPGHPPKLRNHFIFSFIELPISISDPLKRLKKMDTFYTNLKRSTAPVVNFATVPLVGALMPWLMPPLVVNRFSTCLISNFPGAPEPPIFKGTKVLDMMFNAGLGEGNAGLGFCLISCTDHIRLISEADPGILPTDADVKELNKRILEELDVFKKLETA